jgi:hypothetical protein
MIQKKESVVSKGLNVGGIIENVSEREGIGFENLGERGGSKKGPSHVGGTF